MWRLYGSGRVWCLMCIAAARCRWYGAAAVLVDRRPVDRFQDFSRGCAGASLSPACEHLHGGMFMCGAAGWCARGSGLVRAVSGAAPGIQNRMWHSVRRPVSLLLPPSPPLPADWLGQWLCLSSCREAAWRSPLPVPLEAAAADGASSVMVQAGQSQETVRQVGVRGGGSASVSASVVPRSIDDVSRVAVPVPADTAWKARSSGPGSMILWIACVFPMLAWA